MNVTGFIGHIVQSAVENSALDRYGFSQAPRRYTYNSNFVYGIYSRLQQRTFYGTQYDEISESANRQHGDFKTPTPYYIAQTKRTGRDSEQMSVTQDYRTTPSKSHVVMAPTPRSGTVESFGLLTSVDGKAASLLNAKILNLANQWSATVDAAELGQTAGLFKSLASRFLGISVGVARRDPRLILESFGVKPTRRRRRKTLSIIDRVERQRGTVGDAAADLWLEYRYGIRPLVKSLEDYQLALTKGYDPLVEVQVTYPERLDWVAQDYSGTYEGFKYRNIELGHAKKSVRLKASFSFRDSLQARIAGHPIGLALGVGWELLPYSFVLDWIVKVGDWINQLNLPSLVASYSCVKTTKGFTRFTATSIVTADPSMPYSRVVVSNTPSVVFETRSFRREILTQPVVGSLMWGTGLSSVLRQFDAGALIFSNVRRTNSSTFR